MRRLIVSLNITLDGFIAGPNCELDWHFQYWESDMADTLAAELYKADCILFGRKTYNGMMQHWKQMMKEQSLPKPDLAFFDTVDSCKKIVCSGTLQEAQWNNSKILNGPVEDGVRKLKKRSGKNIIVYGSGELVGSLIKWNLVDELHLWLHPVLLAHGKPLFPPVNCIKNIQLRATKTFGTGVILLHYDLSDMPVSMLGNGCSVSPTNQPLRKEL